MWKASRLLFRQPTERFNRHGYRIAAATSPSTEAERRALVKKSASLHVANPKVALLVDAYRNHGHRAAKTNPLSSLHRSEESSVPELDPATYALNLQDIVNQKDVFHGLPGSANGVSVSELKEALQKSYCGSLAIELSHVESLKEREWLFERIEKRHEFYPVHSIDRSRAACLMGRSAEFESFIGVKFPTVKRYSGEGGESMLVAVDEILSEASRQGVCSTVIGMPHRGRNSLMTCVLGHPVEPFLLKMLGRSEFPKGAAASGDTFSHFHLSTSGQYGAEGREMRVSLLPNPSHLEAVAPVAAGKARAKMRTLCDGDYGSASDGAQNGDKVLCLQVRLAVEFSGKQKKKSQLSLLFRSTGTPPCLAKVSSQKPRFSQTCPISLSEARCTSWSTTNLVSPQKQSMADHSNTQPIWLPRRCAHPSYT